MKTPRASASRPPSGRRGFTLLEALLALFIFSTAVISLLEAINGTGRAVLLARKEREVQSRLESLLLETTRSPEVLSRVKTTQPQESTSKEGDVTYVTRTAPLELRNRDNLPLRNVVSVNITAHWMEGRETQEVSAETWVFIPLFLPLSGIQAP